MSTIDIRIRLLSDAAFPAHSATVGAATTLGYVPGGALLGAAAALAREIPEAEFRRAFVYGEVRFSDGLPERDGEVGFAAPLSLHRDKDGADVWYNLSRRERPGHPIAQIRDGFISPSLRVIRQEARTSLRTAVGPDGRARDRHLYALTTLPAGLTFRARISGEDPVLLDKVLEKLTGIVRLGRSRSAELGAAEISRVEPLHVELESGTTDQLLILCASDLALRDPATGAPTLQISAGLLGLPAAWEIDWSRSFLRARRYSPFNGHRRRPELERQVLAAGSVIVVNTSGVVEREWVRSQLSDAVGAYRAHGLGRLLVDPVFLSKGTLSPFPETTFRGAPGASVTETAPLPDDPLGHWIRHRLAAREGEAKGAKWAEEKAQALRGFPISASQWGQVREIARRARRTGESGATLRAWLAEHVGHGRQGGAPGARPHGGQTEMIWKGARRGRGTAAVALIDAVDTLHDLNDADFAGAVERLASRVTRLRAERENG